MVDDTQSDTVNLPVPASAPEPAPAPVGTSAKGRLRAFEDEVLGKEVPRVNDQVEHGHGSALAKLNAPRSTDETDEQVATRRANYHRHAALERLVKTEEQVANASGALEKAKADHAKAEDDLAKHEKAADAGK